VKTKLDVQEAALFGILILSCAVATNSAVSAEGSAQLAPSLTQRQAPNREMHLRPRQPTTKPQRTTIDRRFQTNVITVKFQDGLNVRARNGKLEDFGTGKLSAGQGIFTSVARGRWERVDSLFSETTAYGRGCRAMPLHNC
jgi:hypothetical protein